VLVMPCGKRSLFHLLSAQRIAGFEHMEVQQIFQKLVKLVAVLHSEGIAHNDLKVGIALLFPYPLYTCACLRLLFARIVCKVSYESYSASYRVATAPQGHGVELFHSYTTLSARSSFWIFYQHPGFSVGITVFAIFCFFVSCNCGAAQHP
jgi:hypothetical protein